MQGNRRKISLGFSNELVLEGQHVVYVYADDAERKRTMARFLQRGLEEREKVLYLVADITPDEMRRELIALGVDAETSQAAFEMLEAHFRQCPNDYFEPEYMLGVAAEFYDGAVKDGFSGARGAGEMSWALEEGRTTFTELMGYEARLNAILADHPLTTVCQYDARRFPGDVIMDVLSVHPMAIVRGQLVRNPFYLDPDVFLSELEGRPAEGT